MKEMTNPRTLVLFAFIMVVAAFRVVTTSEELNAISTFTPLGAMALFGGAHFRQHTKAFAFPLLALLISDLVLNRFVYGMGWSLYQGFYYVYGAFALMVLAGRAMQRAITVRNVLFSALFITFIHWIVTDFGVWIGGTLYPKTWAGWWACLAAAIPFERNFLLGTLLYSAIMFGGMAWLQGRFPVLRSLQVAKA
ncbi:DUF6580 family putative transport protein [Roseivirga sp. BDSF3-8]|uniref:DUF6580 family putative transport protein n=1 Tax=Roseivirga sp. BDSF3-8 TaxID=3241598 RepID=UPI0035319F95